MKNPGKLEKVTQSITPFGPGRTSAAGGPPVTWRPSSAPSARVAPINPVITPPVDPPKPPVVIPPVDPPKDPPKDPTAEFPDPNMPPGGWPGGGRGGGGFGGGGGGGYGGDFTFNINWPKSQEQEERVPAQPLDPRQVQERYGLGGLGSIFTGELEALFGELGEWDKEARPGYHIFEGDFWLPQNVGEAYIGLQQALDSPANQVTEIQVMDITTAEELETSIGATVYYGVDSTGAYVQLKPGTNANHRALVQQKEILDTFRPFAMSRVQNAIAMKDEITLQGVQDTFEKKRAEIERTFQLAKTEQEQRHDVNLAAATTKATGVQARATAQVTGQEARTTLNLKYKMEAEEAEKSHARDLEIMESTLWNEQEKIRASTESSKYLGQLNWELEMASTEQKQAFASNQAALDRSLRLGEMEQAGNLQLQANILQAEMVDIKRQQQKMDWITSLISNPVHLYMMKQSGLLGNIDDLDGGSVSSAVEQILAAVPEQSLSNIQQINSRSGFENELDSFNISMQRGLTPEAYKGYVSGTSPFTRGTESRMAPGAPTDYSQFIQGSTTDADIAGPGTDFGYSPSAMGNLEGIMARGQEIREGTAEALDYDIEDTVASQMARQVTGGESQVIAAEDFEPEPRIKVEQLFSDEGAKAHWEGIKQVFPDMTFETYQYFKHIPNLADRDAEWINLQLNNTPAGKEYKQKNPGAQSVRDKYNRTDQWYDKYDPDRVSKRFE